VIDSKPDRLIVMGVITSPHGIRGQVKIKSFTEQPEKLAAYKGLADRNGRTYQITVHSRTNEMLVASVKGVDNRNDAERLRNTELCVPRSTLPKLADGDYYHEDLAGLSVSQGAGEFRRGRSSAHSAGIRRRRVFRFQSLYFPDHRR
jgi:16S rRNA processing protein RimM